MTGLMRAHQLTQGSACLARAALRHLVKLAAAIAREQRLRRDVAMLSRQSDYLLHDIGVTRADIGPRVRGLRP